MSVGGLCGQCRHWKTSEEAAPEEHWYLGLNGPLGAEQEKYKLCALTLFYCDEHQQGMATARDASGYLAGLFTRAEFGCVQFEPSTLKP